MNNQEPTKAVGQSEVHDMTQGPYYDHPLCRAIRKAVIGLSDDDETPNWGNALRSFKPHCTNPKRSPSDTVLKQWFFGKNLPGGDYLPDVFSFLGRNAQGAGKLVIRDEAVQ